MRRRERRDPPDRFNRLVALLPTRVFWTVASAAAATPGAVEAADWPQFRGPGRDGIAPESPALCRTLPAGGFPVVWRRETGSGFAGPVVAGGRVVLFHRTGDEAVVEALERSSGETVWRVSYHTDYRDDFGFDDGPRSPPTIDGEDVFTYGPEGVLACHALADGARRWSFDVAAKLSAPKGFFGRCGAPLVVGDRVLLNIGGKLGGADAGVVAWDRSSGEVAWTATAHEASYASPVTMELPAGRGTPAPAAVFLTRDGLLALEPATGRSRFDVPYRPSISASVNAASPVACGPGRVFVSTCYGVGGSVWSIRGSEPAALWAREGALDCHYATPVFKDGFLYGSHGRQEQGMELRCIDATDGTVRWSSDEVGGGQVALAGDTIVLLTEAGELVVADASPDGFRLRARDQVLARGTRCVPALAGGFLYAKDPRHTVCVDLRANGGGD